MEGTQSESQGLILNYSTSVSSYQEIKTSFSSIPMSDKVVKLTIEVIGQRDLCNLDSSWEDLYADQNKTGVLCSLIFISVFSLLLLTRKGSAKWSLKKVSRGKHLVKDLCVQMPWLHATNSIVPCFTRLPGRTSQGNLTQGNSTKGWINKKPKYELH